MRALILIISAIFFLAAMAVLSPIHAAATEQQDLKIKEIGALSEKALTSPNETVRVIVKMKSAPAKNTGLRASKNMAASQISETPDALPNSKIILKSGGSEFVAASVSLQDLQALSSDSRVESISEDRRMYAFLSESVPLIGANSVWANQIAGLNITGAGTGVCIIDTGVDYTHPDLGECTNLRNRSISGNNESFSLSFGPYANNYTQSWTINKPGYSQIGLHFSSIDTESHYDFIKIINSSGAIVASYSGSHSDIWTPSVQGDTIYVNFTSDEATTGNGFSIDYVINGSANDTYDWQTCNKIIGGYDIINSDEDPFDDNGHGTHVAGIAAANGTLKGVAPGANIVAIKVLNASGSGSESDVASGIDWCVSNSTKFNITAISMSLGGGMYGSYCDNDGSNNMLLAASINAAVAKNISVVVATGNDGATTSMAAPACIENATRVGSVDDGSGSTVTDHISSFGSGGTNRGLNFTDMLLAPGKWIASTTPGNTYATWQGTSMSTPHVSGAIALLSQAQKELYGISQTPQYFKSLLNATGKQINDTAGTKINFSRINVLPAYNALIALEITISAPENGAFLNTDNTQITASQNFISWMNYSIDDGENISACQNCNSFENYSANLTDGLHNLTVYGNNSAVALNYTTIRFTTDTIPPAINFSDSSDANNSFLGRQWIFANLSVNEANFANATFFLFNSSGLVNSTALTAFNYEGALSMNWTELSEGSYYFNATAIDKAGNSNSTETRKITIDVTPPAITAIAASPNNAHTEQNVTISYSIFDANLIESNISITHHNISESASYTNIGENYAAMFSNTTNTGEYNITIYAKDAINRTTNASAQFFVNATTSISLNSSGTGSITLLIISNGAEMGNVSSAASMEETAVFASSNYTIEAHGGNESFAIILDGVVFAPNGIMNVLFSNVSATTPDASKYRFTNNTFSFSPQFNFSSATVCLNYTQYADEFQNISRAKNFKCGGLCENGNWSMLETAINTTANQSCSNVSSFSSFVLGELLAYCGDGNVDAGETCTTCAADAGTCPVAPKTPSGGGSYGSINTPTVKSKNITNSTNITGSTNITNAINISSVPNGTPENIINAANTCENTENNGTKNTTSAANIQETEKENKGIFGNIPRAIPAAVFERLANILKYLIHYLLGI